MCIHKKKQLGYAYLNLQDFRVFGKNNEIRNFVIVFLVLAQIKKKLFISLRNVSDHYIKMCKCSIFQKFKCCKKPKFSLNRYECFV